MPSVGSTGSSVFRHDQFALPYPEGISGHFWTLARHAIVKRKVLAQPGPQRVLDVGCGRGLSVSALRDAGVDCWGVEPGDPRMVAHVRPFVYSSANAFDLPEEFRAQIDTILLLDVIEHLPAPLPFLRACLQRFPRLARIILTVPARAELWPNYDEFYGHYLRYDRRALLDLLGGLGAQRAEAGYFFHALYPLMRVQSMVRRRRALAQHSPSFAALHRLMGSYFDLEERILPRRWYGTSLWASVELGGSSR